MSDQIEIAIYRAWDSGWTQALMTLNAHINTQIDKPNSQTKLVQQMIGIMLEVAEKHFDEINKKMSDTPRD